MYLYLKLHGSGESRMRWGVVAVMINYGGIERLLNLDLG
jgi:hypothetical protein